MPEYLAPGVYVEEVSFRAKPIEGVHTSTVAFIGRTLQGPVHGETDAPAKPVLLTSWHAFERLYGRLDALARGEAPEPGTNQVAHAARAFFNEGGKRLYVSRVGGEGSLEDHQRALKAVDALEDVSIVAAPGNTQPDWVHALLAHVERPGFHGIAVLDTPRGLVLEEVLEYRRQFDAKNAALYYPWIVSGVDNAEVVLPPSGFICGVLARNDVERGVHKAANEIVRGALRFETHVNKGQQEVLNPRGVNCLRYFEGRGNRVWGTRTMSSDPEWKYVNVRRYFNYLAASIERGTQWVLLEPNDERLWSKLRETVTAFLYNEWRNGALLGTKPEEAFFVRCDLSTMTQTDIDNRRLVCLIGVAIVKPAEFIVSRITHQMT